MRGKVQDDIIIYIYIIGSPPPMRGKAGKAWQENNQSRITPAYAGKRQIFST